MAAPAWNVEINGFGLDDFGLFKVEPWFPYPPAIPIIDGLGLLTFGFVWNANASWAGCFTINQVTWSGCSGCTSC